MNSFYSLISPTDQKFFAAIMWRDDEEDGQTEVWSTRQGTWNLDQNLTVADLLMPEQGLGNWDVSEVPESKVPMADWINHHLAKANENHDQQGKFAGSMASQRQPGETDKKFAQRVIDRRSAPKALPEVHSDYFHIDEHTQVIPLDQLVHTKDEWKMTGAKRMASAAKGEISRRDPITITPHPDQPGKHLILDGNTTVHAARTYGWKGIPAKVI